MNENNYSELKSKISSKKAEILDQLLMQSRLDDMMEVKNPAKKEKERKKKSIIKKSQHNTNGLLKEELGVDLLDKVKKNFVKDTEYVDELKEKFEQKKIK